MEKEEKRVTLPDVMRMSVVSNSNPKNYKVGMFVNFSRLKNLFNHYFDDEDCKNTTLASVYSDICEMVIDKSVTEMNKDYGIITGAYDLEQNKPYEAESRINELLKENEKLKSELRDMKGSCKTLSEFVKQKDEEIEKLRSGEVGYKAGIQDGVYIIFDDGSYIMWNDAKDDLDNLGKHKAEYIGVVWSGHTFAVDLWDHFNMTALLSEDSKIEEDNTAMGIKMRRPFLQSIFDFGAEENTNYLRQQSLAFILPKNMYIPTLGQLAIMYYYRFDLNEALEAVGGKPLKGYGIWSSNEGNKKGLFYRISFEDRNIDLIHCKSIDGKVRLVTDFNL